MSSPLPNHDPFAPGLLTRLSEPPRKVVLLRASRIGDFLCATPAFRALRAALPGAEIALVALPFNRELAERSPHLDRFIEFPGFPGMAEQFFDARRTLQFFAATQAEEFDLAVQMHGSGVYSNPVALLLGARVTVGFVRLGDPPGKLDAALPLPTGRHEIRRLLALTTFLGARAQGEEMEFPLRREDRAAADDLLADADQPLIGLHPAARATTKRWAPERFLETGRELRRRQGGTVVILGGPEEQSLGEWMARELGAPVLPLAGKTSLPVLGAVIERLSVLITNDSGPAHLAYALRTPTVTVFGGTDPEMWGPLERNLHQVLAHGVPCRPCDYATCPFDDLCLNSIHAEQAVAAALEQWR